MSAECPVAIDGDDQETDEGQKEGYVDGGQSEDVLIQVDNRCLQRREHGTAEDGHDESCATKLHIIPQPAQGDAIDGGEHQRHAGTDKHQTIDTVTVGKEDDSAHRRHRSDGKYRKQPARLQILQQPRADKPAAAEQHHGDNVVLLREYLSCLFLHALCHEDTCAILDNKGPAHHLRAYREELGDDSLSVILDREYMLQRYPNATASMRVAVFRHLRKTDEQRHDDDDDADGDIGLDKDVEVGALDEIKLCGGEFGAGGSVQGILQFLLSLSLTTPFVWITYSLPSVPIRSFISLEPCSSATSCVIPYLSRRSINVIPPILRILWTQPAKVTALPASDNLNSPQVCVLYIFTEFYYIAGESNAIHCKPNFPPTRKITKKRCNMRMKLEE